LIRVPLTVDPGTVLTARGADAWVVRITDQPGFITAIAPRPTTVTDLEIPVGPGTYASVP
jgi:hypothetical protein